MLNAIVTFEDGAYFSISRAWNMRHEHTGEPTTQLGSVFFIDAIKKYQSKCNSVFETSLFFFLIHVVSNERLTKTINMGMDSDKSV